MKNKHIRIRDVQAGTLVETETSYDPIEELRESILRVAYSGEQSMSLLEAFVALPDAANMLRDGIRYLAFSSYAEMPQSFASFAFMENSVRPQEEWLRDSAMGVLPRVPSGQPAPNIMSAFEGGVTIRNYRYAGIVEVTGDDIRFDRLGKIRQISMEMGRAARMTEEQQVYNDITTTGNYMRNSTTNDNDVGANTQTLTFSGIGLETAYTIISTAKDRKSGQYLGLRPDTLIIGPRLEWAAKQLLLSPEIARTHGSGTAETRGTGTTNVFRGMVSNIVVSPWLGTSYQWALCDSMRPGYVFQRVEPFNIYQEAQNATSEAWLTRDVTRYMVQGYFGTGFVDDRCWFFSDSTTAPTVS